MSWEVFFPPEICHGDLSQHALMKIDGSKENNDMKQH